MIEIGIDSFAALFPDTATGRTLTGVDRVANLLEEVEAADHAGLDVFGIGEHHRAEFLDSAPAILLAAAAARTKPAAIPTRSPHSLLKTSCSRSRVMPGCCPGSAARPDAMQWPTSCAISAP